MAKKDFSKILESNSPARSLIKSSLPKDEKKEEKQEEPRKSKLIEGATIPPKEKPGRKKATTPKEEPKLEAPTVQKKEAPKKEPKEDTKSVRLNLLLYPGTKRRLEEFVNKNGKKLNTSSNDLINKILEKELKKTDKELFMDYYYNEIE